MPINRPREVPSNTHEFSSDNSYKPPAEIEKRIQTAPTIIAANPQELEKMLKHSIETDYTIPEGLEFKEKIGKKGLMWPRTYTTTHPAAALLTRYATRGCPVDCGTPWTPHHIIKALQHGPHNSAQGKLARQALIVEAHNKVQNGHAKILRWGDIKDNIPKILRSLQSLASRTRVNYTESYLTYQITYFAREKSFHWSTKQQPS